MDHSEVLMGALRARFPSNGPSTHRLHHEPTFELYKHQTNSTSSIGLFTLNNPQPITTTLSQSPQTRAMGFSTSNSPLQGAIDSNDRQQQPSQSQPQPHHPESKQDERETEQTSIVHGIELTPLTQCTHYHTPLDIIAIQHYCCRKFYACIKCHDECENPSSSSPHGPSSIWPKELRGEKAVLCGNCKRRLGIEEYMGSGSQCTGCGARFNPGCKGHWGFYFEV